MRAASTWRSTIKKTGRRSDQYKTGPARTYTPTTCSQRYDHEWLKADYKPDSSIHPILTYQQPVRLGRVCNCLYQFSSDLLSPLYLGKYVTSLVVTVYVSANLCLGCTSYFMPTLDLLVLEAIIKLQDQPWGVFVFKNLRGPRLHIPYTYTYHSGLTFNANWHIWSVRRTKMMYNQLLKCVRVWDEPYYF